VQGQNVMQLTQRLPIVMRARRSPGPLIARCERAASRNRNSWATLVPKRGRVEAMTNRDPYSDRETNTDPYGVYDREPRIIRSRDEGLSGGSIIGAFITIAVVAAAMVYAINRSIITTASDPSTTTSSPSTSGQGGGMVGGGTGPSGPAR
jgi:hypothetical protein